MEHGENADLSHPGASDERWSLIIETLPGLNASSAEKQ
jgi:hypothetical protein